jgi:polygalacturonase
MMAGHGGLTLGSCISGGVKNVFAEDCQLDSPLLDTALRVKNNALRGGLLENFYVRNIRVGTVAKQLIEVDFYYEEGPDGPFVPILRNFHIQNLTLEGSAPYSLVVKGYPDHPSTSFIDLSLTDAILNGVTEDPHFIIEEVDEVSIMNVVVDGVNWEYS